MAKSRSLYREKKTEAARLPIYSDEKTALHAAVTRQKADDNALIEVWKAPDGKYVVAESETWEKLYQLGYERKVPTTMIYDIAAGRIDEIEEV